jgi:hypothetical protein
VCALLRHSVADVCQVHDQTSLMCVSSTGIECTRHVLQEVREAEQQMVAAVSQQAAGQQPEEERSTTALAAEASQVSARSTGSVRQQFAQVLAQEQRRAVTAEAQLEVARQQCLGLQVRPGACVTVGLTAFAEMCRAMCMFTETFRELHHRSCHWQSHVGDVAL